MIAYNKTHLDNAAIISILKKWQKNKYVSDETAEAIKKAHPNPLYTPNFFIRIGLFIFTGICLAAMNSLFVLFTGAAGLDSDIGMGIRCIIHGMIMLGVLEVLIREKKIFRAGIDDALLYTATSALVSGFCIIFYDYDMGPENTMLLYSFIALPFLISATIRYADVIGAICSFICVFTILFILIAKMGEVSKLVMPFLIMILSALTYMQAAKYRLMEKMRYWDMPLLIVEVLSLVLFYMAGNYFIVRTLSEELFDLNLEEGNDIPLAFFFYAYTALIPLAYVFFGLKKKNPVLLRTGLILIAVSVTTFKYYFSTGHHQITFTVGGIIMIAVAWFSIRYLKTPKYGITYAEDKDETFLENFDSEALIIAQTFSGPQTGPNNDTQFGGGKFGGGGSQDSF